jgi:hypothetical protein
MIEFSMNLIMRDIGHDDNRAGCQDGLQPRETSLYVLTGLSDDFASDP